MTRKVLSLLLLVFFVSSASAADMFSGTWRTVNAASQTATEITLFGNGIRLKSDSVNRSGSKSVFEFTAQFDGKDYAFKQSIDGKVVSDDSDTVSAEKIDDFTIELKRKRQGVVLVVIKMVAAKDGKTHASTSAVTGENPQTLIYEKQ